jgi:opacity protein-like surface antigen
VAPLAQGASWYFQPAITVGASYEQNADLTDEEDEDPIDATGYELEALARGGRLTERSQIVGSLRAAFQRYPGNEQLDTENLSFALSSAFLATELDRLSLDLGFDRDTSRTSELTTTGNITENVPRYAIRIGPAWERRLTERSTLGLRYNYSQTRFDSNESDLVDSEQNDIDASYSYQLTEQLGVRGALGATSYEPDDEGSYKGYDASLGFGYLFSETLRGNFDIGWQQIDSDPEAGEETTGGTASGIVYSLGLSKAFERSSLSLSVSRSAVPTGSGEPVVQESLSLGYAYQFSPRVSFSVPLSFFRNKTISFGDVEEDEETRIFFSTGPGVNWRVTEDIVLRASYQYQYQRYEEEDRSADGNAVFLSLSYVWPTEVPGLAR